MTATPTLTADLTARQRCYSDLIITAVEGGIGYWSECRNYRWKNAAGDEIAASVEIREVDEDGDPCGEWVTITPATIAKAMSSLSRGAGWAPPEATRPTPEWWTRKWRQAYREAGEGTFDFDASDADTIVQIAALGVLTYG
jgi:hypothetical protein